MKPSLTEHAESAEKPDRLRGLCGLCVRRLATGFTLVELLAVITIIAALTALTVGVFKYSTSRSAESHIRAEIKALEMALEAYRLDHGTYPASVNSGTTRNEAIANSKALYQALSGNSAGTGLTPDPGKRCYFAAFRDGKNGNIIKDSDDKYYVVDPVGSPYNYISGFFPAQHNKTSFDLWSYGMDQTHDTSDDIANWKF
jgi:prepilin-type N-terminal cleavage/methylation domain-containing protein